MKVNAPHEAADDDTTIAQIIGYWMGLVGIGALPLVGGFAAVSVGADPVYSGVIGGVLVLPFLFGALLLLDDYAPPTYHK